MLKHKNLHGLCLATALLATTAPALAQFETGSTGEDGALNVTESIALPIPPNGVFHFTTVSIAPSATVTFLPNARNTPVRMLATGDVEIQGTLDLSGESGSFSISNFVAGGRGGAGGFNGGDSVLIGSTRGANGFGPGPGLGVEGCAGMGGGHATAAPDDARRSCLEGVGQPYGLTRFGSLQGGSGGAGAPTLGAAEVGSARVSGGGGGGAILIASPTRITSGRIFASGGLGGGNTSGASPVFLAAGGGSGGSIQLSAPEVILPDFGTRTLVSASGGSGGRASSASGASNGGSGAAGRILIAANTVIMRRPSAVSPRPILVRPRAALVAPAPPLLRISAIDGFSAPLEPTGSNDVLIPADSPTTITVEFVSSNVPLGQRVTLTAMPAIGDPITVLSSPIEGSLESGTAQASIDVPVGTSTLTASLSYSQP